MNEKLLMTYCNYLLCDLREVVEISSLDNCISFGIFTIVFAGHACDSF